jgi:tRNA(adenine34) deaminase
MELFTDDYFMEQALKLAAVAFEQDEVPIGAVVVYENRIIGKGYNQTQKLKDVTSHAEMIALTAACHFLDGKYLEGCTLYVTIEPCVMCMGAIAATRIQKVVYGNPEPKTGFSLFLDADFSKNVTVVGGIKVAESSKLMKDFFVSKRN